jgi:hypothetical protein
MEVSRPVHALADLPLGKEASGTHWTGVWVGLRASLDNLERRKILPLPGLELRPPPAMQPAASRYDCASLGTFN